MADMTRLAAALALLLSGCCAPTSCAQGASPSTSSGNDQGAAAATVAAAPAPPASAPAGFVEATVEGVVPTPEGNALMLASPGRARVVPVMIGDSEAMVIDLRLHGQTYERPLTHDLLDSMVRELGGTVVMVQVDKLRTGVFIASVFVWDGREMHHIDSRTSDAIAIAVGHHVPIYVSAGVFEEAGLTP